MQTGSRFRWKSLAASATLALAAYLCWRGLGSALESRNLLLTRIYSIACLLLTVASLACLGIPALVAADKRARARSAATIEIASRSGDYTAKFSNADKVLAGVLAIIMVLLSGFLWSRDGHPVLKGCVAVLLTGIVYYAWRVAVLSVRFTSNRVTVRMYPRPDYVQRYTAITGLRLNTGNLHIRFEDGRTVNIWSGMGDAEVIARILRKKTDILPETH
jgi:hypothetical protein